MGWADRLVQDAEWLVKTPIGGIVQEAGTQWQDLVTGNRQGKTGNPFLQMLAGPGALVEDIGSGINWATTGKTQVSNPVPNSAVPNPTAPTTPQSGVPEKTPSASPDSVDYRPNTAWDTSPQYAVVSRMTNDERKQLESTSNGYALSKNAAELTLKYLDDAGVKIDNNLRMQFRSTVHDASREWAQMQRATGRSIDATSYVYFLTNMLLNAQMTQEGAATQTAATGDGSAPSDEQVNAAIASGMQLVDPTGQVDYSSVNAQAAEKAKEKMD